MWNVRRTRVEGKKKSNGREREIEREGERIK